MAKSFLDMRALPVALGALAIVGVHQLVAQPRQAFRTHTTTYAAPRVSTPGEWAARKAYLREHIMASAGLLPMPEQTPLHPVVFGEVKHDDYTVSKVFFESLPGF